MANVIDKALRRELISLAAERLWRRQGVRHGGPVVHLACPTCGAWPQGAAASSHQPRGRLVAGPAPAESRAAAAKSS